MASTTNPFDMRRFGNIFGGAPQQSPLMRAYRGINFNPPQQPQEPEPQEEDINSPLLAALGRLQSGQAAESYRRHLTNMPKPEDYAPSRWRRLGAALTAGAASFGKDPQHAVDLGAEIRDAPLKSAMGTWQLKGAGLKEQADIESSDVKSQIDYIKAVRDSIKDQRDYQLNLRKVDVDQQNADTLSRYRTAQIQNLKAQGYERVVDEQGMVHFYNPTTKDDINFGPSVETTNIHQKNVEAGDRATRTGIMSRNADTYSRSVSQNPFITADEGFKIEALAARNVIREHPEWSGWVNDDFTLKPSGGNWFRQNPKDNPNYKTFLQAIEAEKQRLGAGRRLGSPGGTILTPGGAVPPGGVDFDFDK